MQMNKNEDLNYGKNYPNDKIESMEEEFNEKEKQYLKTIDELKDKLNKKK